LAGLKLSEIMKIRAGLLHRCFNGIENILSFAVTEDQSQGFSQGFIK